LSDLYCCARQDVAQFKIWELKGDWNKGINLEDLYKPAEGREWTPVLNIAGMVPLPPAAQRIGT
jgi:hypothetical protein